MARKRKEIRIPPLPAFIVMEDREDGTEWVVTFRSDDTGLHIAFTDTLPTGRDAVEIHRYGPYDGPYMGQGIRLLARDGRLGYEVIEYDLGSSPPVWSREGAQTETYQVVVPGNWRYPMALAMDDEDPLA